MQRSYRCQNPRLMRFSSTLFYDARVKTSEKAEYYRLSYADRQRKYPRATLKLYRTSSLPAEVRRERLVFEGQKPGLENALEAHLCAHVFYDLARRFPLDEITIIAPYRRQVRLIRNLLAVERVRALAPDRAPSDEDWQRFLSARVATVDSFQGGESDAVVISYVRSKPCCSLLPLELLMSPPSTLMD